MDLNLTISPDYSNEVALSVINLSPNPISGHFLQNNEIVNFQEQSKIQIPSLSKSKYENLTESVHDQNYIYSQEVLLTRPKSLGEYAFQIELIGEISEHQSVKIPFTNQEDRMLYNIAILDSNTHFEYLGHPKKDSDGRSKLILISNFKTNITVEIQCREDLSKTCREERDSKTVILNSCYGIDLTAEEFQPCIDGDLNHNNLIFHKGNYSISVNGELVEENFEFGTGSAYTFIVSESQPENFYQASEAGNFQLTVIQDINTNDVSMLWVLPQFVLITISELLVAITSIKISYSQVPKTMKASMQAFMSCTVAVGNLIIIIIEGSRLMPTQVLEYVLFAGMIGVADVIYIVLAYFYDYVDDTIFDSFEYPKREGIKNDVMGDEL